MSISYRILLSICIGLLLLAVVTVKFAPRTTAAPPAIKSPTAPQQKEKTIAEVQKNIKVLGDYPESQLIPMMNLMAASLGVRCNFCHVNKNGQWDYAADEKPEKNTAREMITMTLAINKSNASVNREVSCYTCHRNRTSPQSVIALPVPETPRRGGGPGAPGGAPGASAAPALPTADEILNKYINAIGGQAAIDKLKTRTLKGEYAAANGMTASLQAEEAAPDKFHVTVTLPQGVVERGYNGSAGWEKGQRGVSDLAGQPLTEMKAVFGLFTDIKLKEQFTRMSVRKDKLNDKDVFMIVATATDGHRERLYFDADTGLLLRRASTMQTPLGLLPSEVNFEDYRDVDGMKLPFTIRVLTADQGSTATRKFSEIKLNVPVDESKFNKPAAQ